MDVKVSMVDSTRTPYGQETIVDVSATRTPFLIVFPYHCSQIMNALDVYTGHDEICLREDQANNRSTKFL